MRRRCFVAAAACAVLASCASMPKAKTPPLVSRSLLYSQDTVWRAVQDVAASPDSTLTTIDASSRFLAFTSYSLADSPVHLNVHVQPSPDGGETSMTVFSYVRYERLIQDVEPLLLRKIETAISRADGRQQ